MGFVTSGSSIQGTAYLTGVGRKYLFNQGNIRFDQEGNDLFEIKSFALGDPDQNYLVGYNLIAGQVPDISGESEGCLKSAVDYVQSSMLLYNNFDSLATSAVTYDVTGTFVSDDILSININFGGGSLPTGTDTVADTGGGNVNSGFGNIQSSPNVANAGSGNNNAGSGTNNQQVVR
jgi:hypothetical protein|tara:strand:+ start:12120 stop:12647 length:528 start_codon:yes stop_codon:yes gene_type:complete